jgi:hypothetical protein
MQTRFIIRSVEDSTWTRLRVCTVIVFLKGNSRGSNTHSEEYDAELERMNTHMITENQGLQHDNKQLNTLIKEYEQTLENLMS